jgi:hypothetical protein
VGSGGVPSSPEPVSTYGLCVSLFASPFASLCGAFASLTSPVVTVRVANWGLRDAFIRKASRTCVGAQVCDAIDPVHVCSAPMAPRFAVGVLKEILESAETKSGTSVHGSGAEARGLRNSAEECRKKTKEGRRHRRSVPGAAHRRYAVRRVTRVGEDVCLLGCGCRDADAARCLRSQWRPPPSPRSPSTA